MSSSNNPSKPLKSRAWKYFSIKDKSSKLANCKICQKVFSYRTSVTNLLKHVRQRHKKALGPLHEDSSDISESGEVANLSLSENEDNECNDEDSEGNKAAKVLESLENKNEEESICLLCQETFVDQSSAKMMEHMIKVHNISQIKLVDNNLLIEQEETKPVKNNRPKRSSCWNYFIVKDNEEKMAICNLCDRQLSFKSTVTNLKKHLRMKHNVKPGQEGRYINNSDEKQIYKPRSAVWSFFNYVNDEKTVCACVHCKKEFNIVDGLKRLKKHLLDIHPEALLHHKTDGELMTTSNEDNNDESEEDNLHEEYLDFDDLETIDKMKIKSSLEPRPSSKRRSFRPRSFERRSKIVQASPSPVLVRNKSPNTTQAKVPDSLEHFSNYIISLLQELPENVSKKLQMDFVKQIIEAQISCTEIGNKKDNAKIYGTVRSDTTVGADESLNFTRGMAATLANTEHKAGAVTISNGIIIHPIVPR